MYTDKQMMDSIPGGTSETAACVLHAVESKAIERLRADYGYQQEDIDQLRMHGAFAVPLYALKPGGARRGYSIPCGKSGFNHIEPKDVIEEQCLSVVVKIKAIRDAFRSDDVNAAISLTWQLGYDAATFAIEARYGKQYKTERELRDEALVYQIQYWLTENPRLGNSEIARRIHADPEYSKMVVKVKDVRLLVRRLRKKLP